MIRTKKKKRNGLFWLIQNIDIKREKEREREREGEGGRERSNHRTLKQTIALKAASAALAANDTELMKSAATGQRLRGGSPIVRHQLTASEQQA